MIAPVNDILISEQDIHKRVSELGKKISEDFAGKEVFLVSVLKGSTIFLADLMRQINLPVKFDTIQLSSYGKKKRSDGNVNLIKELTDSIENKNVIVVEDIIDTGQSLSFVLELLKSKSIRTLKLCTLLDKYECRKVHVPIDYIGFRIKDRFVVGYGLDYQEYYRNLPYIGTLD